MPHESHGDVIAEWKSISYFKKLGHRLCRQDLAGDGGTTKRGDSVTSPLPRLTTVCPDLKQRVYSILRKKINFLEEKNAPHYTQSPGISTEASQRL